MIGALGLVCGPPLCVPETSVRDLGFHGLPTSRGSVSTDELCGVEWRRVFRKE